MDTANRASQLALMGFIVMLVSIVLGEYLQADLEAYGMQAMLDKPDSMQPLALVVFVFGFPLGTGIVVAGAALNGGAGRFRAGLFTAMSVLGVLITLFVHGVIGTAHSPWFFGIGGVCIMVFMSVAAWYWGCLRRELNRSAQCAIDWLGAGLLCMALASWNLCGVGAVPGMALYPEKMMVLEPANFAVAQMKSVMLLLVSGWVLMAIGLKKMSHVFIRTGRAQN